MSIEQPTTLEQMPVVCPVCGEPLDHCETVDNTQEDKKYIMVCNEDECWASFVYIYMS